MRRIPGQSQRQKHQPLQRNCRHGCNQVTLHIPKFTMRSKVSNKLFLRQGWRSAGPFMQRGCKQTLGYSIGRLHESKPTMCSVRAHPSEMRSAGIAPLAHTTVSPLGKRREAFQYQPEPAVARAARRTAKGPGPASTW